MDNIVARPVIKEEVTKVPAPMTKPREGEFMSPAKGDIPLEIYKAENTTPYIDKLLGVDDFLPSALEAKIDMIDRYVSNLMDQKGFKPTTEAYKATLEHLKHDLGIDENTTLEATVERMSKYIDAEQLLKSLKSLDEDKLLRQLRRQPDRDMISLVMKEVEKREF